MTAKKAPRPDNVDFYRDEAGEHRWRITAPNGNRIAAATEGYARKVGALRNFARVGRAIAAYLESLRLPESP